MCNKMYFLLLKVILDRPSTFQDSLANFAFVSNAHDILFVRLKIKKAF